MGKATVMTNEVLAPAPAAVSGGKDSFRRKITYLSPVAALLAVFLGVVAVGIIIVGYLFNIVL
jgi:hypothetical protein